MLRHTTQHDKIPEIFFQRSNFISFVFLNLAVSEKRFSVRDRPRVDLDADAALQFQLKFLEISVRLLNHFIQLSHFVLHFVNGHFDWGQDLLLVIDNLDALLDIWKGM